MGARVELRSEKGEGSTFSVVVPCVWARRQEVRAA
jgi:signal transduction histidine kinase